MEKMERDGLQMEKNGNGLTENGKNGKGLTENGKNGKGWIATNPPWCACTTTTFSGRKLVIRVQG